jgi:four helix bundle protein
MFNFEKLDVWKKGVEIAALVYDVTRRFPDSERFGLVSQMQRASISVASNIAEGSSRSSRIDNARFIEVATGSLFELVTQAVVARQQGFLSPDDFQRLYSLASEESRMLSGLRSFLLSTRNDH